MLTKFEENETCISILDDLARGVTSFPSLVEWTPPVLQPWYSPCAGQSFLFMSLSVSIGQYLFMYVSVSVSLSFSVDWAVQVWSVYISVSLSGLMSLSLLLTVSLPIYLKKKNMVCKVIFCQIGC